MRRVSKRIRKIRETVDLEKVYSIQEAISLLKEVPGIKCDQSVEFALDMGVDPKKSDQSVRGTVSLPHGTGRQIRVLVLTKGEKVQEALDAGAEYAGNDEFIEKIKKGWTDFDSVVVTPDMMREVGKLGKILGPRGLMPTPKAGTVTTDVAKAVVEVKAGKIEFKLDRHGVINGAFGKLSFEVTKLVENIRTLFNAVLRAKPAAAKGNYVRSIAFSSTMGPGLKINIKELEAKNET